MFAERLCHPFCHEEVEGGDCLSAVLLVLVGLEDDGGKRSITLDALRCADAAVLGAEATFKEIVHVILDAGGRLCRVVIEVVNMDIAQLVRFGKTFRQQIFIGIVFGDFRCEWRADWLVSPPELGFLFPAFDDRSTNLYNALYYTRDSGENHPELVEAVFRREAPMPAAAQKETFQTLLSDTLADECSCEVVQAVHDQLCELVEEHRERKEAEPLTLSKGAVKCVLKSCGVSDSHVEEFALRYDDAFGADMALSPRNLVEKQIEVCTPDVVIKVSTERSDLVDTRVIDGVKYILIRADEGVEVNGVPVHIAK